MTHWAFNYIGEPWVKGVHECGHFFVRVQAEKFGVICEVIDAEAAKAISCVRALNGKHREFQNWIDVDKSAPREGDYVAMSHHTRPHHIGVWVDADGGGVLHCVEGSGVIFSSRKSLASNGWNITEVRRHRSMV